jgi:hypothetical protein
MGTTKKLWLDLNDLAMHKLRNKSLHLKNHATPNNLVDPDFKIRGGIDKDSKK